MVLPKRTADVPLICQICGDVARGLNFNVMTCMSCKTFFRRHALQSKTFKCPLNADCQITRFTRGGCLACRLNKCISMGMNSELIRSIPETSHRSLKQINPPLPKPLPLNLLQNDQSTLTKIEWNLLSNILHAYDGNDSINYTKSLLDQQASLAPKLRSKSTITLDVVGYLYFSAQTFLQRIPLFSDLPLDTRRAVIQRNSDTAGTCNSIFLVRETNALDYPAYVAGCCSLYGQHNYEQMKKFMSQLESNGIFFKLMLLIASFSGNCSMIIPEYPITVLDVKPLVRIQNILVTMFWKYLNYQYGFIGAVKCFNSLTKFILNVLRWSSERVNAQHTDMVDTMIETTAQSLTIADEPAE